MARVGPQRHKKKYTNMHGQQNIKLALMVYHLPVDGEYLTAVPKDTNWLTYCLLMCLNNRARFASKRFTPENSSR